MNWKEIMLSRHVKRWHTIQIVGEQTLADHQYGVMLIALYLFDRLVGIADDRDGALQLLVYCMFHDTYEFRTGDIPTPAKANGPKAPVIMPFHNAFMVEPSPDMVRFIKMADRLEGLGFIHSHWVGVHSAKVRQQYADNIVALLAEYGESWHEPVAEVLRMMEIQE